MKTDIQIAQEAQMAHIKDVAATVGIEEEELEFYGKYKAKLSDDVWEKVKDRPNGKLVLVTAINRLRQEEERLPLPLDWDRRWQSWTRRRSLRFGSHP